MVTAVEAHGPALPRWRYALQLAAVLSLLGIFLSSMSVNDAITGGAAPKLFLVVRMVVLVLLCTWFLRQDGERWADLGLRRPRRWWVVPLLAAGGLVISVGLVVVLVLVVLPAIGAEVPQVARTPTMQEDLAEYLFWAIPIGWGTAALGEELLLRGFVLDRITKVIGSSGTGAVLAAIVLQAAIFGTLHAYQGLGGVLLTGMAGLVLGLVWLAGGRNLWPGILLHGMINSLPTL